MLSRTKPEIPDVPVTSNGTTWLEAPRWHKSFVSFGDRLNFLSPEAQQLNTGKLRILPPRGERKNRMES